MQNIKGTLSAVLPKPVKEVAKPLYRRIVGWIVKQVTEVDLHSAVDIGSFGGFEVAYRRDTADENVIAHSFDQDIFFKGVPEYRPADDHVIVDVGAHIGTFSLLASSKVPRGRVYAIEASQDTFNLLRINVALNRADNIDVTRKALADEPGTRTLYYDAGNWGHTIVTEFTGYGETVPTDSLTNFFAERNISHCDFLKLNCEGAEFPILLTTPAPVLQRVTVMLVLYHCDLYTQRSEQDLVTHLRASGFSVEIRERTETRGWIIAVSDASQG